VKKQISLLTFYMLGVGLGFSQPNRSIRIVAQLACFEGNPTVELLITTKDSIRVLAGMLQVLSDSVYLVSDIEAGQTIPIRQITPTDTNETNFLVPVIETGPVLPPIVSESTICTGNTPTVLRALAPEDQSVDWYDAPSGGNLLAQNTRELTVSKAGEYYAETRNIRLTCLGPSRERTVGVVRISQSLCPLVFVRRMPP
jgi:hypothetical protein